MLPFLLSYDWRKQYTLLYPCGVRRQTSSVLSQHSNLGSPKLLLPKTSLLRVEVCGRRVGTHLHMQVQNMKRDGIVGINFCSG